MTNSPSRPDRPTGSVTPRTDDQVLFTPGPRDSRTFPVVTWGVAGAIVVILIGLLLVFTYHKPAPANSVLAPDSYSSSLPLSQLAMSESTSLSGGKSTFIDGHIANSGLKTVTALTVQVFFANDENMPPQVETVPLSLIRTHEPYIDTQPVSAAPLKPGDDREFRLIFETIPTNWNTQMPVIHITRAITR